MTGANLGGRLAALVLLFLLAAALLLALPGLASVRQQISQLDRRFVAVAVALELASDFCVVVVYRRVFDRLPARDARLLAWTAEGSGALLPMPAGIGVLDAGLAGALVLYGVSATHAATAVLVYRAVAFWIPGLGGLLAYLRLRPRLTAPGQ